MTHIFKLGKKKVGNFLSCKVLEGTDKVPTLFPVSCLRRSPERHRAGKRRGHTSEDGVMDYMSHLIDSCWVFHTNEMIQMSQTRAVSQ